MSWRGSGHNACCGEVIGQWSIWREVMKNGSLPRKPCWLIYHQTKRQISSAATRRASISQAGDGGHVEDDKLPTSPRLWSTHCQHIARRKFRQSRPLRATQHI